MKMKEPDTMKTEQEATLLTNEELDQVSGGRGKNGKPTLVLWDAASAEAAGEQHPGLGLTPVTSEEIVLEFNEQ